MQKLGQHFLKDKGVLEKIARAIHFEKIRTIIEIGPGHGELTEKLISQSASQKIRIICIEKDARLAEALKEKLTNEPLVEIITGDALTLLPHIIEARKNEIGEYAIVGNIPYYITGYLLRTIEELQLRPKQTTLLIQREVAERITSRPPDMNRLSASVQFWGDPQILLSVPPGSFNPPPKVDSAVIQIVTKEKLPADEDSYYATVRLLFAQPRKTVLNNLSEKISKQESSALLTKLSVPLADRPQNLSIENIAAISEELSF